MRRFRASALRCALLEPHPPTTAAHALKPPAGSGVPSKLKGCFEYYVSPYELDVTKVTSSFVLTSLQKKVTENALYLAPAAGLLVSREPAAAPPACCGLPPPPPRSLPCFARNTLPGPAAQFGTYGYATEFKRQEDMHHRY